MSGASFGRADAWQGGRVDSNSSQLRHAEVVQYLRGLPGGTSASAEEIEGAIGLNPLADYDVLEMLRANPKVRMETTSPVPGQSAAAPKASSRFAYVRRWSIQSKSDLLNAVQVSNGVSVDELLGECYPGIEVDIERMLRTGEVVGIQNRNMSSKNNSGILLFPRRTLFLTALSGEVRPSADQREFVGILDSTEDLTKEIGRGEAIMLNGKWFRVSTRIEPRRPVSEQQEKAKRPLSVSAQAASSTNQQVGLSESEYTDPYTSRRITIDGPLPASKDGTVPQSMRAMRYGVSADLRELWTKTAKRLPREDQSVGAAVNFDALRREAQTYHLSIARGGNSASTARKRAIGRMDRGRKRRKAQRPGKTLNTHLRADAAPAPK